MKKTIPSLIAFGCLLSVAPVAVYSAPTSGTGTPVISNGVITSITVQNGGSGMTLTPTVSIIDTGGGTGATATATLSNGSVSAVTVTNGGTGYSSSTQVLFLPNVGDLGSTPSDPTDPVPGETPTDDHPGEVPTQTTPATQVAVSSRGFCGALASDPLIAGFFVSGTTPKSVAVFAKGPSLPANEVANPLSNPAMYIVNGTTGAIVGGPIDNWGDGPDASTISGLAQVPGNALDSAIILRDLEPGPYSAIVYHSDQTSTGTALVEVYEFDDGGTEDAKFDGLATRGFCGPLASDPRIVGFIVGGDAGTSVDVIVTAKGPSLPANEVANPLPDPALYIVNGITGALVAGPIDNWSDGADAQTITDEGFAPGSALDSALLLQDLAPGPYTAIAYDADQTSTGTVLVEVYEVDLTD